MPTPDARVSAWKWFIRARSKAKTSPSAQFFVSNRERRCPKSVARLRGRNLYLTEGLSPLGLPYTRPRSPLRRLPPGAWLARTLARCCRRINIQCCLNREAVAPRTPLHPPSLAAAPAPSGRVARSHARCCRRINIQCCAAGRSIPSFRIRNWSVDRFIPRLAAAPFGPAMTQFARSSAVMMWRRSASSRVRG